MKFYGIIFLILFANTSIAGEIAFTFDDGPTKDSALMTGVQRTEMLIKALNSASIPDALFFVKTNAIDTENEIRIRRYVESGYHLGNHSHSHMSANKILENDYMQDVYQAHLILKKYDNVLSFHRFPYLHYGSSKESIDNIQSLLSELDYKDGYVTIDNFDWYINDMLVKAKEDGKNIDYEKLGRIYVEIIWQAIMFYDEIARKSLGRSPRHVLLLHENDTSALFISKLAQHIREKGWKIISPQEAYNDPIAKQFPNVLFHNQGRVAALAHSKGMPTDQLRNPTENPEYLELLFEREQVFQ